MFALDPNTGAEKVLYSFCRERYCADGENPQAAVINVKGTLYGTTAFGGVAGSGTVFAFDLSTGTETVLHSFCTQQSCLDGEVPLASVIDVRGMLYGTTSSGGSSEQYGEVFAVDTNNGSETVIYSFCSRQNCTDGASPETGLIDSKGRLYGTAGAGGPSDDGVVYSIKMP